MYQCRTNWITVIDYNMYQNRTNWITIINYPLAKTNAIFALKFDFICLENAFNIERAFIFDWKHFNRLKTIYLETIELVLFWEIQIQCIFFAFILDWYDVIQIKFQTSSAPFEKLLIQFVVLFWSIYLKISVCGNQVMWLILFTINS